MGFQPHDSFQDRQIRSLKYLVLRMAGVDIKSALRMRDWTYNKVRIIVSGEAKPSGLNIIKRKLSKSRMFKKEGKNEKGSVSEV